MKYNVWRDRSILNITMMLIGIVFLIAGIVLFLLSSRFGTVMRDYTKKSKEYDIVEITAIAIDDNVNVYCLSDYLSAVNVYSENAGNASGLELRVISRSANRFLAGVPCSQFTSRSPRRLFFPARI